MVPTLSAEIADELPGTPSGREMPVSGGSARGDEPETERLGAGTGRAREPIVARKDVVEVIREHQGAAPHVQTEDPARRWRPAVVCFC